MLLKIEVVSIWSFSKFIEYLLGANHNEKVVPSRKEIETNTSNKGMVPVIINVKDGYTFLGEIKSHVLLACRKNSRLFPKILSLR
jgi:hypothetical protein